MAAAWGVRPRPARGDLAPRTASLQT